MINWIKKIFRYEPKFILPKKGDKVVSVDKSNKCVYEVRWAKGDKYNNYIILECSTYFKTGEWKLVDKKTPTRY